MKKGFTLIEIIVYIGIVAIVLTSALTFTWNAMKDQTKQAVLSEVYYNYDFASSKIIYYAERANNFDVSSIYGTNPGKLVINYSSNPQVTIDTYQKEVLLGDQTITITKLRLNENGVATNDLTSDLIDVTNYTISSLSLPNSDTFQITLGLEYINPSDSTQYIGNYEQSFSITIK